MWYDGTGSNQIYDFILSPMVRSDHDSDSQTPSLFGTGRDTIGFFGAVLDTSRATGIPPGFDEIAWQIHVGIFPVSAVGSTICIDSASFSFIGGVWLWDLGDSSIAPSWDGPYCFEIVADCCEGLRGNINLDLRGEIDISDLVLMVAWLYKDHTPPECLLEADVNADDVYDMICRS